MQRFQNMGIGLSRILSGPSYFLCGLLYLSMAPGLAVELVCLTPENFDAVAPRGKEVDAIYGDWVLRNDQVVAVLGQPIPGRKANMTVRGVGGMLIDFTTRYHGSDQLSCFYPGAGHYLFEDSQSVKCIVDENTIVTADKMPTSKLSGKTISLIFEGKSIAPDGAAATVTYTLTDQQNWLDFKVQVANHGSEASNVTVEQSFRCDGNLFTSGNTKNGGFYVEDKYFGQCYGLTLSGSAAARVGSGRNMEIRAEENAVQTVAPDESCSWSGVVFCSQGLVGVESLMESHASGIHVFPFQASLKSPAGPVAHALVELLSDGESLGILQSSEEGTVRTHLPVGNYIARVTALGHEPREQAFEVGQGAAAIGISLGEGSRVRASITDDQGKPIPAKVQFVGIEETATPDFGPDSAISAIKNVVYCASGKFEQPLAAGKYQVIISHGPEFDADFQEIIVSPGKITPLNSQLPRTVDTTGWISSEFHSHSTPSGDNVSHQTGRVLNLLAEHLEFAPCTEHARIDTYDDDLELLGATSLMATCTGMELTGGPLPINHQNAFPLHRHQHEQDGGGPDTDADPEKQIERLALWDNNAAKVVQTNHPNIPSILGDRDLNGEVDEGFRKMLKWMDVIEVHPPEGIFTPPAADISADDKRLNPIFHWMQLLNFGYRVPGVVNTDAHYNFHGSGWLRNYMKSSTDLPSQISIDEMIQVAEKGQMVMTSGPFLEAEVRVSGSGTEVAKHTCGEDINFSSKIGTLWIKVQCPNWFDVNRVQVFANGRPLENMNFTRKTHPEKFSDAATRFESVIVLPQFDEDTHLIVATIGEGLKLGPVMGEASGELPPVAVTNPFFLDIDGNGFTPNQDDLGVPVMLSKDSHEHETKHDHTH